MNHAIAAYICRFEGKPNAWLRSLVSFMRKEFPQIPEALSYGIPMYRFDRTYIAFSVAKEHLVMHTLDFEQIEQMRHAFQCATFGKGCVRIDYQDEEGFHQLFSCIRRIVELHAMEKQYEMAT